MAGDFLDIQSAGPPFVGLDNGVGFYSQTDGNFVNCLYLQRFTLRKDTSTISRLGR
ncbi:hypothetical protein HO173_012074 [Letharia columbiana]|uniref:Uncharacterized protein n=1 Tax=Letharia columbiana TaxID=112416 RepID=A0A8H6CQH5_9LECA|nr:uncharacterized protein HO173_012074 [Letharia columbiana]KAF6227634.1 hypothetical protein HO173_012074 [Letharia columbiana]